MTQLILDITPPRRPTLAGFVPGRNGELLDALARLAAGEERERFLYLWGEAGAGRSHLLQAAVEAFRARHLSASYVVCHADTVFPPGLDQLDCLALDDADQLGPAGQLDLFHLYNRIRDGGRGVLLASGRAAPARLALRPDLVTRLGWGLVYQVQALSDAEKAAALAQHAAAKGFRLPQEVADYLLRHGRRDLPSLVAALDALDRLSLATKRPVTVPLLREILQAAPRAEE